MKAIRETELRDAKFRCVVCEIYYRPLYVPWQQHALGCSVRADELRRLGATQGPPRALVARAT